MTLPRGVRRRFRLGDVRSDVASDVDEELRHHFDRMVDDLVALGWDRDAATARAGRRFGDVEAYRRALVRIDEGRDGKMKRIEVLDTATRTVGQALRGLARSPGFTVSVVTILALGLGANAVMFNVVDRLLLSPPAHVVDANSVRALYLTRTLTEGTPLTGRTMAYGDYADFKTLPAFQAVAAISGDQDETLGRGEGARRVRTVGASASFFPLLGVRPQLGRFFSEDEDAPGAPGTVVLSYEFWQRAFGADPGVLGRTLDLDSGDYTVIGVTPPAFTGTDLTPVDLWLPLETSQARRTDGTTWKEHRNWWWLHVVARLAPGATPALADEQATAAHRHGREDLVAQGRYDAGATIRTAPVIAALGPRPSEESRVARWLGAVSVIVLLIACFNVANLLLARGTRRRRELAVRVALGVSRRRLVAQLLVESLILAALGGAAALVLAQVGGRVVYRNLLPDVGFVGQLSTGRLLLFLGVATLVAALVAGVAPALHAIRSDASVSLKSEGGGGRSTSRARMAFLVAQAALSVV
ncbi:MAG TPA: ABC transporter permease, partial [Longimicrobiales bacterium]|nr:ABC transporter permease [Longimicrobiales bacterium]